MSRSQANAVMLAVAVIWGLAFVPQAWGMADMGPMAFTGLRFALGAMVVAPLAWREHRQAAASEAASVQQALPGGLWLWTSALGVLIFAGAGMQQMGLLSTSVTNAGFLTGLYVPLVPILGWWFFKRAPHPVVWPAALGCLLGTWLLAGAKQVEIATGDWWVIASCIPWALHITLVGWVAERWNAPYRLACVQFTVCAVLGLAAAGWLEPLSWAAIQAAGWAIAYTGLISVGVGYTAQVVAQRHTHPADAAIILSSETVFAALFGAMLMGDRLSLIGLAGCFLILVCIVAAQWVPLVWRRGESV